MKKLALDVGDKTIGVAVSDALNITAPVSYTHLNDAAREHQDPKPPKVYDQKTCRAYEKSYQYSLPAASVKDSI